MWFHNQIISPDVLCSYTDFWPSKHAEYATECAHAYCSSPTCKPLWYVLYSDQERHEEHLVPKVAHGPSDSM